MDFDKLVHSITPEIYQQLITAIELGKWANGKKLTPSQLESALQVTIAYAAKHSINKGELFSVDASGHLLEGKQLKAQQIKNRQHDQAIDVHLRTS